MATNPSLQYLALDEDYDPVFDPNQALTGVEAVAQAVQTRLNLFMGEWWEDRSIGVPYFQKILGQLASSRGIKAMQDILSTYILETQYVVSVQNVTVNFENGVLSYSAGFTTVFGQAAISGQVAVGGGAL